VNGYVIITMRRQVLFSQQAKGRGRGLTPIAERPEGSFVIRFTVSRNLLAFLVRTVERR
jgi:hypothetical protein